VDTLKHRWMFTNRQVAEFVKPPQRLVYPGLACLAYFIVHAPNATVCWLAQGATRHEPE